MSTTQDIASSISDYYVGRSIFITGGTGFMGKVLLEKLLRSCPGITRIYVLIRTKKGQSPQDRLSAILEGRLFSGLRKQAPHVLEKVSAIAGDITEPKLAISPVDEETLINEVSVIFHAAATVKFDDDLADSIKMNVKGTLSIIQLARKMNSLSAVVHVSTAYSHCYTSSKIEEKLYPMPESKWSKYSPDELIKLYEDAKNKGVDNTKDLIGVFPNTYTFTKAMAEKVIADNASDLPIAIMRPSIVVASWKEPLPGWVDNLNGPTGIIAAAAFGVLRTVYIGPNKLADIMPVDFAISLMCAIPWKIGALMSEDMKESGNILVYNCTSGSKMPFKWRQLEDLYPLILKYPVENMIWYPYGTPMTNNIYLDRIYRIFYHWVPAYLIDGARFILRMRSLKLVNKMNKLTTAMNALEYFSTREWSWERQKVDLLFLEMSEDDQSKFDFSLRYLKDWNIYFENYVIGMREIALKQDSFTVETCKLKLQKLHALDQGVKWLLLFLLGMFSLSCIWDKVFYQISFSSLPVSQST